MGFIDDLRQAGEESDLEDFHTELLADVRARVPDGCDSDELDFAFVCEVGGRLLDAEEFQDFIPCRYVGLGPRNKKLRVDGYEFDEADDSIRLLIADFGNKHVLETIIRTRAESLFTQLKAFVDESATGRIWTSASESSDQIGELCSLIKQKHSVKHGGGRSVSRYRFYLITDSKLSDRVKDLPEDEYDGVPVEYHIWDISRLKAVSSSILGTEELEIDFTEFVEGGLPCLKASKSDDYDGFLCVIPGDALAELYDRFGSRLLEGNVRSFLSTSGKINRGIQGTIRAEPGRFFVYNNGISATATSADVRMSENGPRLCSARYLQIVNGGQTTASLQIAKRKDNASLEGIHVQMKLSVVKAKDTELLDSMIQNIAKFSNSQNKVSDADFFSNHPFHRAMERRSRSIKAPASGGAQFNTFWFYERARGQYLNMQSHMTLAQKRSFQRENPRAQLITKTDLAKYENSWLMLPHVVSRGAQKNFVVFAEYVGKEYGADGYKFDNDLYFKEVVARAILFKFVEKMVSQAKATWYGGDYRAQIVTYTLAKLASVIETEAPRLTLDLKSVWTRQSITLGLAGQLEEIAKVVARTITIPPVPQMNVGEWCKKEDCWDGVWSQKILLTPALRSELISAEEASLDGKDARQQGEEDSKINAVIEVVRLNELGCWRRLSEWCAKFSAISGTDSDLVRSASRRGWIPSDRQANRLIQVLRRKEHEGFRIGK
ncbi:MAG: AIPR family protein [Sterolibacteriaceae bacterium]|uniref:AIPR family protein n=1 Tax=Candidatus Methylophosphatis roskildensis TaxID=2899263 RepID=A0A9D7E484_9PROT|nr:AIPR family protein [Candidatus Methylophosphatis roskildensis]